MSKQRQQEAEMGEGLVFAHIKEGYWNSLQASCQQYYRKTSDPFFVFWKAYAHYQNNNVTAAINDLLSIQTKKEIAYACIVALMHYQNQARNLDKDQLSNLRSREREERKNGADKAFVQAIYFYCLIKEFRKASDLLQQKDNNSPLYITVRLWYRLWNIEEVEDKNFLEEEIDRVFKQKDKLVPKIQLFTARCTIKNLNKKYRDSLQTLNEGIVLYPTFIPFKIEKCVCLMSLGDWKDYSQTALQVSQIQTTNISAVKALAFFELAQNGNIENASLKIKELESLIDKKQNKNPKLLYESAHLFLRVCGRNKKIVEILMKILEKCRKSEPLNADYAIEMGNQYLMLGQIEEAYKLFQEASSLDQSKLESITGMIECKLLQDDIEDAESQIQFVNVMTQTVGRTPVIAYLQALLTIKKPNQTNNSLTEFYRILDEALRMQIAYNKTLTPGFSYYSKLNPDFLFSIAQLYLKPVSTKQMMEGTENPNPSGPIGKGIKLLERITNQISGFVPAYLLLAKGKLAVGNELDASMAVAKVLQMDSRNEEASIILAMIRNKKKDFESALNCLQEAIAINFKIRENPLFMLIKGQIEYEMKNFQAAQETMVQAISLPSVKRKVLDDSKKFKVLNFSEKDRCSIYLLLAKCYIKNAKQKQSRQIMTQAISQFAGTNEEVHVLLTNAFIAVQSNDIKKAMSILKAVKSDSTYFVESRKMLADIHLKYLKSRKGYARCYYEIIQSNPSFENYKIYGDALIKINEPEEASIAYEKAYQQKPDNESIIRDLGRSYALAHNYQKATKFYEDNIQKLNRPDLILDLAKLCIQLRKYDRAEQLLNNPVFNQQQGTYESFKQSSDAHLQLFRMYLKSQNKADASANERARKQIKLAVKFQKGVYDKVKSEGGAVDEEKLVYADLYYEVGKYAYTYEKNVQTTELMLKECLKLNQEHQKALEILAEIYLNQGKLEESQTTSQVLLKINSKNEQAGSILAEILLKSNQYEKAIERFRNILDQNPDKYAVLSKLIDFFRRSNQLSEAKTYIEAAQNKANNTNDAGLCYCRGLYHKYSRNLPQALVEFNKAKKSTQYAENSIFHMIDIFLCPEQQPYYSAIEGRTKIVHPENIRICQSLVREMSTRASWHRYVVMEALVAMCSGKNNINLEEIAKRLVDVLVVRSQYPPAMLAIAIAKFLQKKDVQGNNFLKLCAKLPYQPEYGQELEKAWLLHAQTYVQIKKFDNAQQTIRMILKQNKSSGKAYELLGLIKEKQQAYVDAAQSYEKAFELTQKKSPSIGYRLAYNYMKGKRYVDCLETCRLVLEVNPKYDPIKIDIQSKVMEVIR